MATRGSLGGLARATADAASVLDAAGKDVVFSGYNGYEHDSLAKGWLRASHRELDPERSTPLRTEDRSRRIGMRGRHQYGSDVVRQQLCHVEAVAVNRNRHDLQARIDDGLAMKSETWVLEGDCLHATGS